MLKIKNNNQLFNNNSFTAKEIVGQPNIWLKLFASYKEIKDDIKNYLNNVLEDKDVRIILTGAGTSAFIGDVLYGIFNKNFSNPVSSIPTTDLITHPEYYFKKDNKYLLISFARSGSSPESSQTIILAEELAKEVYHIVITCNNRSELIRTVSNKNQFTFLMPLEANDKGLAMTGSFTTMLLAGILLTRSGSDDNLEKQFHTLYQYGNNIINNFSNELDRVAELDFKRSIFLGSGTLKGIARESHLKLQELTDGKVICKYDSFLGVRHGPKAVIDDETLIVYLFSNNNYVNKYELDLVNSILSTNKYLFSIGVMEKKIDLVNMDLNIVFTQQEESLSEDFLPVVSIIPAQILGFFKSIKLGLNPDNPSERGMIHRVVQGVQLYSYKDNGRI